MTCINTDCIIWRLRCRRCGCLLIACGTCWTPTDSQEYPAPDLCKRHKSRLRGSGGAGTGHCLSAGYLQCQVVTAALSEHISICMQSCYVFCAFVGFDLFTTEDRSEVGESCCGPGMAYRRKIYLNMISKPVNQPTS